MPRYPGKYCREKVVLEGKRTNLSKYFHSFSFPEDHLNKKTNLTVVLGCTAHSQRPAAGSIQFSYLAYYFPRHSPQKQGKSGFFSGQ
jgi:hypothetical protein